MADPAAPEAVGSIDYVQAAAALFNAVWWERFVPLLTLLLMVALLGWSLHRAQNSGRGFDAADFFRDEQGRLQARNLFAFICCVAHTWMFVSRTYTDRITFQEQVLYCLTWSTSLVLLAALDAWRGGRPSWPPNPPDVPPAPPRVPEK